MAILQRSGLFHSPSFLSRLQTLVSELQRWQHTLAGNSMRSPLRDTTSNPRLKEGSVDILTWRTLDSKAFGIRRSAISCSSRTVLKILRHEGFEAYLVGGCVRDLLLKKIPKDFDVITTASLKQIKKHFHRCMIVGRRFPICQVSIFGSIVEVSSFDTTSKNVKDRETNYSPQMLNSCDKKDFVRWKNCMERDFTINGLFYDPFVETIYDYVNGVRDLRTSEVRTVIPPHLSFEEDCARILRGLRIVARLGLRFSKETAAAIRDHSSSIMTLTEQRLMMELNFMLAYGAAESSISLLQKFKLLDILLPVHAAYLTNQTRKGSSECSIMLLKLFSNVDRLIAADHPSNCSLWVGLLAFHLALLDHPQDALVVSTFSSFLYHGIWSKAVTSARESCKVNVQFSPEILVPSGTKSDESLLEDTSRFALLVKSSVDILTSTDALESSLARYPDPSPSLGLVFVPKKVGENVKQLFDMFETDMKSYAKRREAMTIDYELLKKGQIHETRFVLGKVIMDTMNCVSEVTSEQNQNVDAEEKSLHDELANEEIQIMARSEKTCLDELNHEQSRNVAAPEKSCKQNQKVAAVRKIRKPNQNVAAPEKSYLVEVTDEQNQNVVSEEKSCIGELFGEQNQNKAEVNNSCKDGSNVVDMDNKQSLNVIVQTGKQNQNVVPVKKGRISELSGEQNQKAVSTKKIRKEKNVYAAVEETICLGEQNPDVDASVNRRRLLLSALFK